MWRKCFWSLWLRVCSAVAGWLRVFNKQPVETWQEYLVKSWLFYCDDCSDSQDLGDKPDQDRVKARMSVFMIVSGDTLGPTAFRQRGVFKTLPIFVLPNKNPSRLLIMNQFGGSELSESVHHYPHLNNYCKLSHSRMTMLFTLALSLNIHNSYKHFCFQMRPGDTPYVPLP